MRWTRQRFARKGIAGQVERFVSDQQHADERRLQRTAKSCGPDAPTLASSSRMASRPYRAQTSHTSADDGGKKSPVTGESAKEAVKTIACGNAGRFRCTRCYSCAFYQYKVHTRPRVQRAPGIPHALLGAKDSSTARAHRVARRKVTSGFVFLFEDCEVGGVCVRSSLASSHKTTCNARA
jgi:hypothetical protein